MGLQKASPSLRELPTLQRRPKSPDGASHSARPQGASGGVMLVSRQNRAPPGSSPQGWSGPERPGRRPEPGSTQPLGGDPGTLQHPERADLGCPQPQEGQSPGTPSSNQKGQSQALPAPGRGSEPGGPQHPEGAEPGSSGSPYGREIQAPSSIQKGQTWVSPSLRKWQIAGLSRTSEAPEPGRPQPRGEIQAPPASRRAELGSPSLRKGQSLEGRVHVPQPPGRGRAKVSSIQKGKPGIPQSQEGAEPGASPVSRRDGARQASAPGDPGLPPASRRGLSCGQPQSQEGQEFLEGQSLAAPSPQEGEIQAPLQHPEGAKSMGSSPASSQCQALQQCPHPCGAPSPVALLPGGAQRRLPRGGASARAAAGHTEPRASVTRGPLSCL